MKERPGQSHNSTLDTGSEQKSFSPTLSRLPLTGKRAKIETQKGHGGETQKELACLEGKGGWTMGPLHARQGGKNRFLCKTGLGSDPSLASKRPLKASSARSVL